MAPTAVPLRGTAQVPCDTIVALPQEIGVAAKRTSYAAGRPLPSLTSVKARDTELSVTASTVRSSTVPGGGRGTTVIVAAPLRPLLVAVMVATPGATAVTRPAGVTVATLVLLLDHLTAGSAPDPDASPRATGATLSLTVSPTKTLADAGVTIRGPDSVGAGFRHATSAADRPAAPSRAEARVRGRFAAIASSSIRVGTPLMSKGGNEAKRPSTRCDKSCRAVATTEVLRMGTSRTGPMPGAERPAGWW